MKTAAVLLALLLHAQAASIPDQDIDSMSNENFLASLLSGISDSGSPNGDQEGNNGGGTQQGKVKCGDTSDIDSLSTEIFLALLNGNCEPEPELEPAAEVVTEHIQTCERGEFQCTPYHRCREEHIVSDALGNFGVRIGLDQFERDQGVIEHSECPHVGDVCCTNPLKEGEKSNVTEEPYEPQCGRRNNAELGLRIADSRNSETKFAEFPWQVAVLRNENIAGEDRLSFVCAGSLVHPQVILTAAHSVKQMDDAQLLVRLGEWDTQYESEPYPHEDIFVREIRLHPAFHPTLLRDDVALLVLHRPVQRQRHIDTLCLPSPSVNYDSAQCVTAGWGKNALEGGVFQTQLKKAELPHVPRGECQAKLRKTPHLGRYFRLDRSFTCAGGNIGEDACKGDGGAALACRDPHQPDSWVQIGVVSWGLGCGEEDIPGVYADVRRHVDWIEETIGEVEQKAAIDLSLLERSLTPGL